MYLILWKLFITLTKKKKCYTRCFITVFIAIRKCYKRFSIVIRKHYKRLSIAIYISDRRMINLNVASSWKKWISLGTIDFKIQPYKSNLLKHTSQTMRFTKVLNTRASPFKPWLYSLTRSLLFRKIFPCVKTSKP